MERDISNCWAPTVETAITKVKTPVMNSEAKVLVPGVPGHHAPIKLLPAQPKEAENKRKLGSKEVVTACSGWRVERLWGGVGRARAGFQETCRVYCCSPVS